MSAELPSGTVTLLFTDIEGSTRMLQELGRDAYVRALTAHRRLLREAFSSHGGVEVEMQGDSFHFAFASARDAVAAAVAGQRALAEHAWELQPIRVRIGLHTGEPIEADRLYAGLDVHRAARVMSAGHGGQILLSERTAELVGGELPEGVALVDLGWHRLKDLTAPQLLYQLGEGEFPALKTLMPHSNLPVAATPLIGRERELAELKELVLNGAKVVTVTGTGGAGKTRVALQVAAQLVDLFRDGVFWVPLAGVRDHGLVLGSVAQAVGASGELAAHLAELESLLVLDNFEHVIAAAAPLGRLLAAAPRVKALVTSRGPLHVDGEHEFPLDPLTSSDGVTLFVERARAAGRTLEADETVAEICRSLDYLPLALELAAARTKLLSPEALLARLERRLSMLTGGRRDAPERQQTLRATIEWSHELLQPDAQRLFARLSVFAGSFSLDAAESVCDAELDTLGALVDLSLLKAIGGDRFLMLETIREYARERLADDAAEALRHRHAEWFLAEVERGDSELVGPNQRAWLGRLEADYDDVRIVLGNGGEGALRLAGAMGAFWKMTSHVAEGRVWLDRLLSGESGSAQDRAPALAAAAELAIHQNDYRVADSLLAEATTLYEEAGDTVRLGEILAMKAWILRLTDDLDRSLATAERALALVEGSISPARARVLRVASVISGEAGHPERSRQLAEECLALRRELDDQFGIAILLADLAMAELRNGDAVVAKAYAEEGLALLDGASSDAAAATQHTLAVASLALDDVAAARKWLVESLSTFEHLGDVQAVAACLELAAAIAVRLGRLAPAVVLAAASAGLFERSGLSDSEVEPIRSLYASDLARARAVEKDHELSEAWESGFMLAAHEATERALRLLDDSTPAGMTAPAEDAAR